MSNGLTELPLTNPVGAPLISAEAETLAYELDMLSPTDYTGSAAQLAGAAAPVSGSIWASITQAAASAATSITNAINAVKYGQSLGVAGQGTGTVAVPIKAAPLSLATLSSNSLLVLGLIALLAILFLRKK